MDITEVSIVHHIAIVLLMLWILASIGWAHTVLYFGALLYLFAVNQRYTVRLRRKLQHEEQKYANQRRLLSDSESVRWLNHAIEKIWPICMEQIASQHFLLPIIPWFLDKYKPWTVVRVRKHSFYFWGFYIQRMKKLRIYAQRIRPLTIDSEGKAVVENLYLGRNPPMFTEIRVLGQSSDDDHLVLELGMSFLSAKDMSAILAVQLRKSLGLGMWTNMHVTAMHVEGKVLVGVKFLRQWPFIGRMRVCFAEVPYFQMTVKPIFNHGIDVTELPGIAGWLDNLLVVAFEQTLVQPNMLVIDVEKFVSTPSESWFAVYEKPPIAYVKLEIIEAADMKPSDLNGLADPYVKGHLGTYRLRTKIHKKTLTPKWFEEFKIPILSWEVPNLLSLEVRDKDHIFDDLLGECSVNISDLRGGQRHDKWLTLKNVKKGRLHLAITVYEDGTELSKDSKLTDPATPKPNSTTARNNATDSSSLQEHQQMADEFEPINIEGQQKTGLWVHRPGKDIYQTWEPRKGRSRRVAETELQPEGNDGADGLIPEGSGSDENADAKKTSRRRGIGRRLQKLGSYFQRSPKMRNPREAKEELSPSPHPNIRAVEVQGSAVRIILDESIMSESGDLNGDGEIDSPVKPDASNMKGVMKRKGSTKTKSDQALEGEESSRALMEDKEMDAHAILGSQGKAVDS